ncbi:MAG: peroxidase-related enzyme [Gammaproteobacteria bacterium]|nr:peroxidase-related enzyme [Gammaproteobacteria bacterium]
MTWITIIPFEKATGSLKRLYDRIKGPDNNVDNIMLAHSLRPHTMEGHMTIYKYVLHHPRNELPKWYLEAIGVYVSQLNRCAYCFEHHLAGMARLLDDEKRAAAIRVAFEEGNLSASFNEKEVAGLEYTARLTQAPSELAESDIERLRTAGFDDGEILEINQVAAYFSYANRTVLGLGVNTEGDDVGLSPGDSENPDNWSHA